MHADPAEARDDRGEVIASIEAILELGEHAAGVLAGAAIGAGDRALDIAERGIDPLELRQLFRVPELVDDQTLVRNSGSRNAMKATEPIGDDAPFSSGAARPSP